MAPTRNDADLQSSGLAIDVGDQRIGVACANLGVRFARPLTTLDDPENFISAIVELCAREDAAWLVVGLPRGLNGQDTPQTAHVREFGARLQKSLNIPVYWIDEALTSAKAEDELRSRKNGHNKTYAKGDIDALAATYILEDFLREGNTG